MFSSTVRNQAQLENFIKKVGEDDMNALEQLYIKTERTIYSYVLSILKNPETTVDMVQDTYIKVMSSAHLYRPEGKPLAWLFTIAKNLCYSHLRGKGKTADMVDGFEDDINYSYIEDPTDRLAVEAAMTVLNEKERRVVLLHSVSGYKQREVAELLEIPLATATSIYNRSLKKMQRYLKEAR